MTYKQPERKLPQRENTITHASGVRRRCVRGGHACWVQGEFGRLAKILCGPCISTVRKTGWKVTYQIEGDKPPALIGA